MAEKKERFALDIAFADLYTMYGAKKAGAVLPALIKWALDDEETVFNNPELAKVYEEGKLYIIKGI